MYNTRGFIAVYQMECIFETCEYNNYYRYNLYYRLSFLHNIRYRVALIPTLPKKKIVLQMYNRST